MLMWPFITLILSFDVIFYLLQLEWNIHNTISAHTHKHTHTHFALFRFIVISKVGVSLDGWMIKNFSLN